MDEIELGTENGRECFCIQMDGGYQRFEYNLACRPHWLTNPIYTANASKDYLYETTNFIKLI